METNEIINHPPTTTAEMTALLTTQTGDIVRLSQPESLAIAARLEVLESRLAGYLASDPPPNFATDENATVMGRWGVNWERTIFMDNQWLVWSDRVFDYEWADTPPECWVSYPDRSTVPASQVGGMA